MCYVAMQVGSDLIANLSELLVVDEATVRRSSCDDEFGTIDQGSFVECFVVDDGSGFVKVIREDFEILRGG